jgi:trehalose 6-phosphate phosphatase
MAQPLFQQLKTVHRELRAARHVLLGLDFDGTLAPLVSQPGDARIPDDTRAVLEPLASMPGVTLAIISGRALSDVIARTGIDAIYAGNHGFEIRGQGFEFHHPRIPEWQQGIHRLCLDIRQHLAAVPGALVEDKGITATVHFRNVAESETEKLHSIVRNLAATYETEFELRDGKKSIEIRPRVSWNKGSAVLWLRDRLTQSGREQPVTCYIGDDETDEDVFRAVEGITIRVGSSSPTAARFYVNDPEEVKAFLIWLSSVVAPTEPQPEALRPHSE